MQIIVERVIGQAGFEKSEILYEGDRFATASQALKACFNAPENWKFEDVRPTFAVVRNSEVGERYSDCAIATAQVPEEGFEPESEA